VARARSVLGAILFAASTTVAGAQVPVEPPHMLRIDPSFLTPGQFVYATILEHDITGTPLGTRTVSVAPATYAGANAWLLLETRVGDAIPATDSLFVDPSMHPIHWGSTISRARLSAEFRGDSIFGGTMAPAGRKSLVAALPPGTLINAAMLETELRLLPLQTAWEDSASTISVALNGISTLPTRIAVIGEDRVRVPAGQFDCWVVSVRAGDVTRGMYWVTKQNPIVVRSALDVPGMNGAQYVSSLTRMTR
jgi:hypothetical protein